MAYFNKLGLGSSSEIPAVSRDYYLAGSTTIAKGLKSSRSVFYNREEKYRRAEVNFPRVYEEELGEKLPTESAGIVVIQQWHYPFDFEIAINPALKHRCAEQAIMLGKKIMRQPQVFTSRTYWLSAGKRKLERLLDCETVLKQRCCAEAVVRYMKLKGEKLSPLYMGTQLHRTKRFDYPYRVWRLQRDDLSVIYLLVSLLNGAIFELSPEDLPDMLEAPAEFKVGAVQFKVLGCGDDYFRG